MQRLCRLFWSGRDTLRCGRGCPLLLCWRDRVAARHAATAALTLLAFVATAFGPAALPVRPPVAHRESSRPAARDRVVATGAAGSPACCCSQPGQRRSCGCRTSHATGGRGCCAAPHRTATRVRHAPAGKGPVDAGGVALVVTCVCDNAPAGDFVSSPQPKMAAPVVGLPTPLCQALPPQPTDFLVLPLADGPETPPPRWCAG